MLVTTFVADLLLLASRFWQASPACLSTTHSRSFDGYLDRISTMPLSQISFTPVLSDSITLHDVPIHAPSSDENVMVRHAHDLHTAVSHSSDRSIRPSCSFHICSGSSRYIPVWQCERRGTWPWAVTGPSF